MGERTYERKGGLVGRRARPERSRPSSVGVRCNSLPLGAWWAGLIGLALALIELASLNRIEEYLERVAEMKDGASKKRRSRDA